MAKGISINVGINQVKSSTFSAPPLNCCEADANAMFNLACAPGGAGFLPGWKSPLKNQGAPLLGDDATFKNVVDAIHAAAAALDPGDVFLFTFAGHGVQTILKPGEAEPDGVNETVVLVDHMILDSFWNSDLWPSFKPGVRAVAIADCCHGKGVFTNLFMESLKQLFAQALKTLGFLSSADSSEAVRNGKRVREIDDAERRKELNTFKEFYDSQRAVPSPPKSIDVSRILLSACQANEDAVEDTSHGAFTQALLNVWNNGGFQGDYKKFIKDIRSTITGTDQHPDLAQEGQPDFTSQRPFSI